MDNLEPSNQERIINLVLASAWERSSQAQCDDSHMQFKHAEAEAELLCPRASLGYIMNSIQARLTRAI